MLIQIHIRDLATIQELHLQLQHGATMITGETGAGKSIFIEAIELALGGRSSPNLIRAGKEKAEVSLCFDITHFPHVIDYLTHHDLYQETPECIIRRMITADGRSRCYINGAPATLQATKELGEYLFHLHGQYEQQVLLKSETQRDMLDRYADHLALAADVKQSAEQARLCVQQIQMLKDKQSERVARSDYLRFQLNELEALELKAGEWEILEMEHHKLTHAEELIRQIQQAKHCLNQENEHGNHQSLIPLGHDVRKILESIQSVEPQAQGWLSTLNSALIQLSELNTEFSHYLDQLELDPEKLQSIEERVSQIFNLSRKHKISPQELPEFTKRLQSEFGQLNASDDDLLSLEQQLQTLKETYASLGKKLSHGREAAAKRLEKEVTQTIRSLSLPHGEFKIALEPFSTTNTKDQYAGLSLHGYEKIHFLIKTNPDQSLQPLAKVISGGELSRLSLALHLALAHKTTIPTLIFDEVDTGLSGATAEKIGRLLQRLGQSYQVFCVTHQPQVAACGHHHLLVEKYFIEKSTHTRLRTLDHTERTREIARMLGGEKITEKTIAHATEMLSNPSVNAIEQGCE